MFILPDEAQLIRRVEAMVIETAAPWGFQEVIFPRCMPLSDWIEVSESLGPLSSELKSELVQVSDLGGQPMAFCHWQCEPYYRALRQLGAHTPARVVDRSGWSVRNEQRIGPFRSREFLRVELVWRGSQEEVAALHAKLLGAFQSMLKSLSLKTERVIRDDEMRNSNQRLVEDLVATAEDGVEVELVGSHLHGSVFVRRFWHEAPVDMETACMGISLSRIAAMLLRLRPVNTDTGQQSDSPPIR